MTQNRIDSGMMPFIGIQAFAPALLSNFHEIGMPLPRVPHIKR